MSAPKFTAGPWLLYEGRDVIVERGNADEIGDEAYQVIATARVHGGHHFHCVRGEEQLANARLIAAAPELYAQLEFAVKLFDGLPGFAGTAQIESMHAALAKAAP